MRRCHICLMCDRRHDQRVAVPSPGGKPHPRVFRIRRRMRPAVHPERPALLEVAHVQVNRHQLLRLGMALVPDPHVQRTAQDVRRRVSPALMLGHRQSGCVPRLGECPRALVDRQPQEVAERRPGNPLRLVLVEDRVVAARDVELRRRRARRGRIAASSSATRSVVTRCIPVISPACRGTLRSEGDWTSDRDTLR